jgi:hypothetical protein
MLSDDVNDNQQIDDDCEEEYLMMSLVGRDKKRSV